MKFLIMVFGVILFLQAGVFAESVKIGVIVDNTGQTKDLSVPYALGISDYIKYNGEKIQLEIKDYKNKIPRSLGIFQKLCHNPDIIGVLGWGRQDGIITVSMAEKQNIAYLSAGVIDFFKQPFREDFFDFEIKQIEKIEQSILKKESEEKLTYIQGWITAKFLCKAIKKCMKKNNLTRKTVKKELLK